MMFLMRYLGGGDLSASVICRRSPCRGVMNSGALEGYWLASPNHASNRSE